MFKYVTDILMIEQKNVTSSSKFLCIKHDFSYQTELLKPPKKKEKLLFGTKTIFFFVSYEM